MASEAVVGTSKVDREGSAKLVSWFYAFKAELEKRRHRWIAFADYWSVTDVLRSASEQAKIHSEGKGVRSGESWHEPNAEGKSEALDIYAVKGGKINNEPKVYEIAEEAAKAATDATGISHAWSGYFKTGVRHYSHFSVEQSTGESIAQAVAGITGKAQGLYYILGAVLAFVMIVSLLFRGKRK